MMEKPFCIAVCDDEQRDLEQITAMTKEICELEHIHARISGFADAETLLQDLGKGRMYDLFLIDVMMPRQDGMELAEQLRSAEMKADIVFISNNREMALRGYEVAAVRYLAKPLDREKLREAITFCYGRRQEEKEFLLPIEGGMKRMKPEEIISIEIVGRKSRIRTEQEEWDVSLSIGELEQMLSGKGFIRCHQSFLINSRYVHTFRTSSMEMKDGRSIPVSKHRIKEVRKAFFDYMKN